MALDGAATRQGQGLTRFSIKYGKGPSRWKRLTRVEGQVKASCLRELMENKDRLLIMGHRLADTTLWRGEKDIPHLPCP